MHLKSAHECFLRMLPSDWEVKSISDVGSIVGGSTPSRDVERYWGGDIPWVTPGELTSLTLKYLGDTREHITQAGLESCGARLLPAETLLVTSRATIEAVALASRPTSTNQGFKSVVFAPGAEPSFYFHLFKRLIPELTRRASGTTFLEISGREFGAVRVPVPPFEEQQTIAEILDTIDEAIRRTEQIIAKLKQIKQGLLHDLLTRGIDENGELRDPERRPGQFRQGLLGVLPKGWSVATVGKLLQSGIINEIQDGNHGELHPKRDDFVSEGVPFIMAKDIAEGRIDLSRCYRIRWSQYVRLRVGFAKGGDILLSHKGTIGNTAILPEWASQVMLTPQVTYYRLASAAQLLFFC